MDARKQAKDGKEMGRTHTKRKEASEQGEKEMKDTFYIDRIEVRGPTTNRLKKYLVRGYAIAGNIPHTYHKQYGPDGKVLKSFKSLFTQNFINNFANKLKHSQVYVDALHQTAKNINIKHLLKSIREKGGKSLEQEVDNIESQLELGQLPLAKVSDFRIDDNGIFVETELNPAYRELDDTHKKYFDAVWDSLQGGFLNGMSIDFKPTKVIDNNGMSVIDDGEVFGINYMNGAALGSHSSITEVAVRSILNTRTNGGNTMETETKKTTTETNPEILQIKARMEEQQKYIERMKQKEAEEAEKQATMQQETIAKEKDAYKKQVEDLQNQLQDLQKKQQEQPGRRGTVAQPPLPNDAKTAEWYAEMAKKLSWEDLVKLQAEYGLHHQDVPEGFSRLLGKEKSDTVFKQ